MSWRRTSNYTLQLCTLPCLRPTTISHFKRKRIPVTRIPFIITMIIKIIITSVVIFAEYQAGTGQPKRKIVQTIGLNQPLDQSQWLLCSREQWFMGHGSSEHLHVIDLSLLASCSHQVRAVRSCSGNVTSKGTEGTAIVSTQLLRTMSVWSTETTLTSCKILRLGFGVSLTHLGNHLLFVCLFVDFFCAS